jgi:hypothetical protein
LSINLQFESPDQYAAVRTALESADPRRFEPILQLVGLRDFGAPIRVVLAAEDSEWAQQVSPWIAGFALGASGNIVVFPSRNLSYPHDSLEDVLRHEVAHVLVARAAAGGSVPRWFHEGLAMAAERAWGFEDQTRILFQLALGPRTSLDGIDRLFRGGESSQSRAYVLAGAFVRDLRNERHDAPAEILARVRSGDPFDEAFESVLHYDISDAETRFWTRQRIWNNWVPLVTSTAVLWMLVTLIALLAIRRRRRKDAEIRNRWDEEETQNQDPARDDGKNAW